MNNVVLASNLCQGGDSGEIVAGGGNAKIRNVAGIVTGQHQNKLIYVKVMELKSRLNITVY